MLWCSSLIFFKSLNVDKRARFIVGTLYIARKSKLSELDFAVYALPNTAVTVIDPPLISAKISPFILCIS